MAERVMIFIDGSNLFWACRNRGIKVDYDRLRQFLAGSRILVRTYYYCSTKVSPTEGQQKFHEALRFMGIEVVVKTLVKRKTWAPLVSTGQLVEVEKDEEKGVDIALVTDLLSMGYKNAYDTAIVVGADADFEKAFKELKQMGKRLEIAAFSDSDYNSPTRYSSTVSREIRMIPDQFIALENHLDEYAVRDRVKKASQRIAPKISNPHSRHLK